MLKDLTFAATCFASRRLSRLEVMIRRRRAGRLIGSETQTVHRRVRRAAPPARTGRLWRPVKEDQQLRDMEVL